MQSTLAECEQTLRLKARHIFLGVLNSSLWGRYRGSGICVKAIRKSFIWVFKIEDLPLIALIYKSVHIYLGVRNGRLVFDFIDPQIGT